MKKFLLAGAAAFGLAGTGVAIAQVAPQPTMKPMHMAKPQTRADVQARVQKMFARLDTNRDGFIDQSEIAAAKTRMHGRMADRQPAAGAARGGAFDRLDTNHDGNISRQEFDTAMQGRGTMMHHAGMRHMGAKMLERADANRDGRISLAEAQQAALARFEAMDLNHDGTVTPDERLETRKMRMPRKPA